MILLSSPLKNDPPETTVKIFYFLEIEIVTTKIVNSKSLKKICRQLLSTMNVLKILEGAVSYEFVKRMYRKKFTFRNSFQKNIEKLCR